MLPPLGYGQGKLHADDIVQGCRFSYVLSAVEGIDVPPGATPQRRVRYVGHAGDFVFLLDPNKSVLAIAKFESGRSLLLGRFPAKVGDMVKPPSPAAPALAASSTATPGGSAPPAASAPKP